MIARMATMAVTDRLTQAMEAHDLDALLSCFSEDAVVRSPVTSRIVFRGHNELIAEGAHGGALRGRALRQYAEHDLVYTATTGRQDVEVVNRLEINGEGLIDELTVYVRPLPGLAAMAAALGPPLAAHRRSHAHALALRLFLTPLAFVLARGDHLARHFA